MRFFAAASKPGSKAKATANAPACKPTNRIPRSESAPRGTDPNHRRLTVHQHSQGLLILGSLC
jgi:hypothetical protein